MTASRRAAATRPATLDEQAQEVHVIFADRAIPVGAPHGSSHVVKLVGAASGIDVVIGTGCLRTREGSEGRGHRASPDRDGWRGVKRLLTRATIRLTTRSAALR